MNAEVKTHQLTSAAFLGGNIGMDLDSLRYKPIYELGNDYMIIRDPVWGDEHLGEEPYDQVLVDLAHTDALRRLQTIEQLTLPERYSTIPDSYYFSRWEHAWGSVIFVRRMARQMGLEPKAATYLQLKVLLSDFKHTAFSHAGDWLFEDEGGAETEHEIRDGYAEMVGINRLMKLHGFDPARVFDDETRDITDMPKPALDGDRIDYTLRESYRWVDQSPVLKEHLNKDSFTVVDGRIVTKDVMAAKMLAMCHTLLVTEYWHDPVERLQLRLLLESLKRVFVARNGQISEWGAYSPRDLMTTADHTFIERFEKNDEFTHLLDSVMTAVADSERTIHWRSRRDKVRSMLEKTVGLETENVSWIKDYYDILPPACEVTEMNDEPAEDNDHMVVVPLRVHRERYLDPEFIDENNEVQRLSEAEPDFWEMLQTMLAPTRKNWQGALIQNKATTSMLKDCFVRNEQEWPGVLSRPRLSSSAVRQLLRQTVHTSIPYASRFVEFTIKQ